MPSIFCIASLGKAPKKIGQNLAFLITEQLIAWFACTKYWKRLKSA